MSSVNYQEMKDFLSKTDAYLSQCTIEERQALLQNFQKVIENYLEKNPGSSFLDIKKNLGGPREVANYLLFNAGKKIQKINHFNSSNIVMILALSSFLSFIILVSYTIYRFTPLVSVKEERIQLLGGLIDIDSKLGSYKMGDDFEFQESKFENVFEGSIEIAEEIEDLNIVFNRGQVEFSNSDDLKLSWNCKMEKEPNDQFMKDEKDALTVNLAQFGGTDCVLKAPTRLKISIQGESGKVDLQEPGNDTYVQLINGMVLISPNPELKYRFESNLSKGVIDQALKELKDEGGIEIKVDLQNGSIQKK